METKVAAVAPAPDPQAPKVQPTAAAESGKAQAPVGPDPVTMRLVIELDQASGSYVYKTVNRETGEVVRQLPRAEVLKLKGGEALPGSVISTEA